MRRQSVILLSGLLAGGLMLAGCGGIKVKRVDVKEKIDVSGQWNDTDSQMVSQEMIEDCVNRIWLTQFVTKNNRQPVVIVGSIVNRSQEHINAQVFIKDLERSLINSAKVKFVASSDERLQVRDERENQQIGLTRKETMKKIGDETGADFMLIGDINAVKDEVDKRYVILYQTNLDLIDLQTNETVWIGQKMIKKEVTRSRYSM